MNGGNGGGGEPETHPDLEPKVNPGALLSGVGYPNVRGESKPRSWVAALDMFGLDLMGVVTAWFFLDEEMEVRLLSLVRLS